MRALVYTGPNALEFRNVDDPTPRADECWSRSKRWASVDLTCTLIMVTIPAARHR
jgi:hypothetical protein